MSTTATLPAVMSGPAPPAQLARGVEPVVAAVESLKAIRTFVAQELRPNVDFGMIPGTGDKPTLLKPGAEKIALYYQTRISYHIDRLELGNGHLEVNVRCDLLSRGSGHVAAEGHGSCTTMESKYRWRKGDRTCPQCGQATIIKGKAEYGGGWLCFAKRGGCGAKFPDGDPLIESQQTGRVENPDVWDGRNTVLKMALKRALVSAVLSLGSLSELFTQDIEDVYDLAPARPAPPAPEAQEPADPRRTEVNDQFKPKPAAAGRRRDERTPYELIEDGLADLRARFAAEFPEAPREEVALTRQQVERHLVKTATGKSTEGMSGDEVRAKLQDLYGGAKRGAVRKELKDYLDTKFVEARSAYVASQLDRAGGAEAEVEDESDPDIAYEQFPDEPGANG